MDIGLPGVAMDSQLTERQTRQLWCHCSLNNMLCGRHTCIAYQEIWLRLPCEDRPNIIVI